MFELTTLQACQITAVVLAVSAGGTVVFTVGLARVLRRSPRCRDCARCGPPEEAGADSSCRAHRRDLLLLPLP